MSKIKILENMIKKIVKEETSTKQYSLSQLKKLVDDALEMDGAPDWFRTENPEAIKKAKSAENELIKIGFMNKHGEVKYSKTHPMKLIFDKLGDYMDDEYM